MSRFWEGIEAKYRPTAGTSIIEDPAVVTRIAIVAGLFCVLNSALLTWLFFANGEHTAGWITVGSGAIYVMATLVFIATGGAGVYMHAMLWSSLVLNVATHIVLGGFVWSGAFLMWGIIVASMAALFMARRPAVAIAAFYALAGVVFAFLEPTLRSMRDRPEPAVSTWLAVDVFVISILLVVPVIMLLMRQIVIERARSESLLLNVLPESIAGRLKRQGGVIADEHPSCTVLFADLVGFTDHASHLRPELLIVQLNSIFSRFDGLVATVGAEKIKTMGDGYLAVAGAPEARPDHASVMCQLALEMQRAMSEINAELGTEFGLRVGLNTGRLVAGVVGTSRFSYDLWGDTVNLASRMENIGPPGRVRVTRAVVEAAGSSWLFEDSGTWDVKGKGPTPTFLLIGEPDHIGALPSPDV